MLHALGSFLPNGNEKHGTLGGLTGWLAVLACLLGGWSSTFANTLTVKVTITNLAPSHGTYQTPVFVGFHDGTFDFFDEGSSASSALESLAEDGNTTPLTGSFDATANAGAVRGVITGPGGPFAPSESGSMLFHISDDGSNRYLSFASMVIPSNDTFVGNDNPTLLDLFQGGSFQGLDVTLPGSAAWDAGTEVNDEIPMNTAFFGQMNPNTGVDENGVVHHASGFLPPGSGGILDSSMFANADYTASGYDLLRIQVSAVPEPSAGLLFSLGAIALVAARGLARARRRRE